MRKWHVFMATPATGAAVGMDLFVDGSFRMGKQTHAYATVVDGKGRDMIAHFRMTTPHLFHNIDLHDERCPRGLRTVARVRSPKVVQQNNYAELMAMMLALRMAHAKRGAVRSISTDSSLVHDYWSRGRVNAMLRADWATSDPAKLACLDEVVRLRRALEHGEPKCVFRKIPGKSNPADLGYHK